MVVRNSTLRLLLSTPRQNLFSCQAFATTFQSTPPRSKEALRKDSTLSDDSLQQTVRHFVHEEIIPKAAHHDETGEFPWEILKKAHAIGLMNTGLPTEMGGLNLSLQTKQKIYEEIAYGDTAIGTSMMVNEAAQTPLIQAGSSLLKDKYLKKMLKEPILASLAITEPEAGSDATNIKTKAELKGDHYVLNGSKNWITNGAIAEWYFVLARTNFDSNVSAGRALTGFVVDRNSPGIIIGKKEKNMGQRCADTRAISFEHVTVPVENVVGNVNEGFRLAMRALDRTRPIIAIMACGLMQRALDEAGKYAVERKTFGKIIAEHEGIGFKLADMAMNLEAARELAYKSARMIDANAEDATYYSSCAKAFAADAAFQAAANAVQIFGANGYNMEYPVEKLLRDSKVLQLLGGTSEIQRKTARRLFTIVMEPYFE
ncbi:acyl-CoA dehydrogenase, middle domain-containing protein [Ditylenchus destructor]|uniref:Acyl-CoA dehydrogenase, middle domain-containing protein n=1 Tax=Ditylenchus destructor TaxID=166010 RepID=A0AAD4NE19_9BILA|nr:acyl-CoA dehydrogenase, middle domain-containing protein [Ditylenchus destructor]